MKQTLSASRAESFLSCPRKHFLRYELGIERAEKDLALRFGSAWHRLLEARHRQQLEPDNAVAAAFPDGVDVDEVTAETVVALFGAYCARYAQDALIASVEPEIEFRHAIQRSMRFEAIGRIDGLARLHDGRLALLESKTTSSSLDSDSDYWIRLRFNPQILQYVDACWQMRKQVETIVYDVVRKPSIAPRSIPLLDEQGCKIVLDAAGQRVMKADGKPRESGDAAKGYTLQTREETAVEFGERLYQDACARPEFYFARREVPILHDDVAEFRAQQLAVGRMILACRANELNCQSSHHAWPRHISQGCDRCEFASFCLQNISVNMHQLPAGFVVRTTNQKT